MKSDGLKIIIMTVKEVAALMSGARSAECQGYRFDAEKILPGIVVESARKRYQAGEDWFWCAPRLFTDISRGEIIGSAAFKNPPSSGKVEIGYGISSEYARKGYATKGVACLLDEAFAREEVTAVTAEASVGNIGSQRVLEKNGFTQTGTREDSEDGLLSQWIITRARHEHIS